MEGVAFDVLLNFRVFFFSFFFSIIFEIEIYRKGGDTAMEMIGRRLGSGKDDEG